MADISMIGGKTDIARKFVTGYWKEPLHPIFQTSLRNFDEFSKVFYYTRKWAYKLTAQVASKR